MQTFIVHAYTVQQWSMQPTLEPDERLLADKITPSFWGYGRGQVVIIDMSEPEAGQHNLVKRIVGLPGESVELTDGSVLIDGLRLEESYVNQPTWLYDEDMSSWELGENEYFVLGDNRASSLDSRAFGPISRESIVGHVFLRYTPFSRFSLIDTPDYEFAPNSTKLGP